MKRSFCIFLAIFILIPCLSFADNYSPALGMDFSSFITKYNSIGTALNSPLVALKDPFFWSVYENYNVAWYKPDKNSNVTILLLSADPVNVKNNKSGLDSIQIFMTGPSDFLSLITITNRCTQVFSNSFLGSNFSALYSSDLIAYYYENATSTDFSACRTIDTDQIYNLNFFIVSGQYYFTITLR